jgi:hypothetical protein
VEKEFMISGLRRQRDLLNHLLADLEAKPKLMDDDCSRYETVSKEVEKNLKKLRRLRKSCFECSESAAFYHN